MNALDLVRAAAEPACSSTVYAELVDAFDRSNRFAQRIREQNVRTADKMTAIGCFYEPEQLVIRVFSRNTFRELGEFILQRDQRTVFLVEFGANYHVRYPVGAADSFQDIADLARKARIAAIAASKHTSATAATEPTAGRVGPGSTFRAWTTLVPTRPPLEIRYKDHTLRVRSALSSYDPDLTVSVSGEHRISLTFSELFSSSGNIVKVYLTTTNIDKLSSTSTYLTHIPDRAFQNCTSRESVIQLALTARYRGKLVIDYLLTKIAKLPARTTAAAETEPSRFQTLLDQMLAEGSISVNVRNALPRGVTLRVFPFRETMLRIQLAGKQIRMYDVWLFDTEANGTLQLYFKQEFPNTVDNIFDLAVPVQHQRQLRDFLRYVVYHVLTRFNKLKKTAVSNS